MGSAMITSWVLDVVVYEIVKAGKSLSKVHWAMSFHKSAIFVNQETLKMYEGQMLENVYLKL